MTYPSNRTKRYEHSIGTMELVSLMLFSAVSNANSFTREALFKELSNHSDKIYDLIIRNRENQTAPYFIKCKSQIDDIFTQSGINFRNIAKAKKEVMNKIRNAMSERCFVDVSLDHFQFYQIHLNEDKENDVENLFLYRCLLQAMRIVALFHDVGHPPYSHIIESVLEELYYSSLRSDCNWQEDRKKEFQNALSPYMEKDQDKIYKCNMLYCTSSSAETQLHEAIGLSMLQSAINSIIPEVIIKVYDSNFGNYCKVSSILYYIFTAELAMAILTEKDLFFESMHKMVDGPLDTDRLDYIMRDSLNSGVDWDKIPYKRIINSAKLFYLEKDADGNTLCEKDRPFIVAYPKKVSEDIVDLLLVRYKIFANINFHHRCMRTTVALQSAVLELAQNYLSGNDDESVSDINTLWMALDMGVGYRDIRVIEWNDSWLISTLHKALVKLIQANKTGALRENLEEILLNKKRYYALIKRGSDSKEFVKLVLKSAGITDENLVALRNYEYEKYYSLLKTSSKKNGQDILKSSLANAEESLKRLRNLIKAKKNGDLELLNQVFPLEELSLNEYLDSCMEELRRSGQIDDYNVLINNGRRKTGLPSHKNHLEEIYLYFDDKTDVFNDGTVLMPQINSIESTVPWIYIYFVPPKDCKDVKKLNEIIFNGIAVKLGEKISIRYKELFSKRT